MKFFSFLKRTSFRSEADQEWIDKTYSDYVSSFKSKRRPAVSIVESSFIHNRLPLDTRLMQAMDDYKEIDGYLPSLSPSSK